MDDFFSQVAEILEEDDVNRSTVLRDSELWDSLTALSLIAMVRTQYGVTITADEMKASLTAGDLYDLTASKKDG